MDTRPEDLVEIPLSFEPDTLVVIIKPNQWNSTLAENYAYGVLLLELYDDVRGRKRLGKAFLNPDPIVVEGVTDPPPPEADPASRSKGKTKT